MTSFILIEDIPGLSSALQRINKYQGNTNYINKYISDTSWVCEIWDLLELLIYFILINNNMISV